MEFNEYFTETDLNNINTTNTKFNYSYHLVVTFPNIANIDKYINKLNDFLNNKNYHYYCWHCNTSKKFKKSNNPHKRRKHIHLVLFTSINLDINFFTNIGYDIDLKPIYDLDGILKYIHDGHHILHNNYYNSNTIAENVRDRISRLRLSDR